MRKLEFETDAFSFGDKVIAISFSNSDRGSAQPMSPISFVLKMFETFGWIMHCYCFCRLLRNGIQLLKKEPTRVYSW